jgi:hypothetical protein
LAVLRCLLIPVLALFLPAALRYQFSFNSLAPGLLMSCALLCGMALMGVFGRLPFRTLSGGWLIGLFVLTVILVHLGISLFQSSADLTRAFSSLGALVLVLAATPIVFHALFRADDPVLSDTLAVVRVALLVMTAFALLGIQPTSPLASERPIWPFTEPSHFALAAAPFFIDGCIRGGKIAKWLWLGVMSALVLLLKSVVLGVATVIGAICCLGLIELGLFAMITAAGLQLVDLTYFTDRLALSHSSSNLSALVYLQGVELIEEALETTRAWGIGFQQLGFAPTNVLATEMIRRVGGGEQNLADGSFLAVKLGAEFGVLGLFFLSMFLFKLASAIIDLRLIARKRAESPVGVTFALGVFTAFFIELFVRGVGYFSGSALLAFAAFGIIAQVKFRQVASSSIAGRALRHG